MPLWSCVYRSFTRIYLQNIWSYDYIFVFVRHCFVWQYSKEIRIWACRCWCDFFDIWCIYPCHTLNGHVVKKINIHWEVVFNYFRKHQFSCVLASIQEPTPPLKRLYKPFTRSLWSDLLHPWGKARVSSFAGNPNHRFMVEILGSRNLKPNVSLDRMRTPQKIKIVPPKMPFYMRDFIFQPSFFNIFQRICQLQGG